MRIVLGLNLVLPGILSVKFTSTFHEFSRTLVYLLFVWVNSLYSLSSPRIKDENASLELVKDNLVTVQIIE